MSRHRLIRDMDLDAELDEYDAEEDYLEEGDGLTELQKQQLRDGLRQVRSTLGADIPGLKDQEIEDSLWYYYFDVDKTVNYLINAYTKKPTEQKPKGKPKTQPKKGSAVGQGLGSPMCAAFDAGFFLDCPWGQVPQERQGVLIAERNHRGGGLLGGSSAHQTSKISKLAALAKARKEKKQNSELQSENKTAVSLLSRLSQKPRSSSEDPPLKKASCTSDAHETINVELPPQKENVVKGLDQPVPLKDDPEVTRPEGETIWKPLKGSPSGFAASVFGGRIHIEKDIVVADDRLFCLVGNNVKIKADAFSGPSPDDVVQAAQKGSKGLNKDTAEKKPKAQNKSRGVEEGIQSLNIQPTPPLMRPKLDVLKEYKESAEKENINFVVVGHVDAGKSTLMGRILYDTGAVDEKVLRKYKQEAEQIGKASFALAWVLDQTQEERNRGVTIDTAVNKFETDRACFTILDAPGHRDFVPNMIAGASRADFAVLVIDSSTGAFESGFHLRGQTKEHTLLVRSMGVQKVVVVVNKLDTVGWSQARFEEIVQQMTQFLTNAGFGLKNISFVPCSGLEGINVVKQPEQGTIPWYSGPTLMQELETINNYTRAVEKPFRLTVSDIYKGGAQNHTTISGRIESGYVQEGDTLVGIPNKEEVVARTLLVNDEPKPWAVAGHNVVIYLSNVDQLHMRPGDVLCKPNALLIPLRSFTVKLLAFEILTPMAVDIHRGQLHAPAMISGMVATFDKATGAVIKKKPRHITPGSLATVRIELTAEPIPVEAGNRVVLRSNGQTVAAGIIEDK